MAVKLGKCPIKKCKKYFCDTLSTFRTKLETKLIHTAYDEQFMHAQYSYRV